MTYKCKNNILNIHYIDMCTGKQIRSLFSVFEPCHQCNTLLVSDASECTDSQSLGGTSPAQVICSTRKRGHQVSTQYATCMYNVTELS